MHGSAQEDAERCVGLIPTLFPKIGLDVERLSYVIDFFSGK